MKQELKDVIDELNECFDYACSKVIPCESENKARHRMDFLLGVVSSLYLESFQQNNSEVKYEMCLKCKSCEEK